MYGYGLRRPGNIRPVTHIPTDAWIGWSLKSTRPPLPCTIRHTTHRRRRRRRRTRSGEKGSDAASRGGRRLPSPVILPGSPEDSPGGTVSCRGLSVAPLPWLLRAASWIWVRGGGGGLGFSLVPPSRVGRANAGWSSGNGSRNGGCRSLLTRFRWRNA